MESKVDRNGAWSRILGTDPAVKIALAAGCSRGGGGRKRQRKEEWNKRERTVFNVEVGQV